MAIPLSDLRASVFRVLRDASKSFITDADVTEWLNEAQEDLAIRLKSMTEEATGAIAAAATSLALPANYLEAVSFRLGTADEVEWVDDAVFNSWKDSGDSPSHYIGRIFGSNIEWWPAPETATTYTFRYVERPTAMVNPADTFDLPDELARKAIKYAQAHAKYKEHEIDMADRYLEMYERGLPPAPLGQTATRPGPINIGYVPTDWDVTGSHRG